MKRTKTQKTKYMAHKRAGDPETVQKYGEELERLATEHGGVTAEIIVQEAEKSKSVFHSWFEWNNGKAAHEHRLMQARALVRWIEVEVVWVGSRKPRECELEVTTRAFQAVEHEGERRYQPYEVVRSTVEFKQQVEERIAKELERLAGEMRVYKHLEAYAAQVVEVAKKMRKTG